MGKSPLGGSREFYSRSRIGDPMRARPRKLFLTALESVPECMGKRAESLRSRGSRHQFALDSGSAAAKVPPLSLSLRHIWPLEATPQRKRCMDVCAQPLRDV